MYLANSPLVGQIVFTNSGALRMTTAKQYDYLNRLTSISSTGGAVSAGPVSFNYAYNAANQRVRSALLDGSYWVYSYDSLGQVISGNKYWSDGTPVAGQQFDYTFDTIGNRTQTQAGGDQTGANLRLAHYTNNPLNQITSRDVPGDVDVMGLSLVTNSVTVNLQSPYRRGEYFRYQLGVTNSGSAVWTNINVVAGSNNVSGNAYVARTPENYTYDLDGNVLSDGRWTYAWDGENRLLSMTSLTSAPNGSQLQLTFAYDYLGRRIQKIVSTNNGSAYVGEYTNYYLYDGWNCVAILNPSLSVIDSFMWGNDLSGSMQGAGGVGGLLKVSYYGAATTNCFVAFDGNGNVSALINAADGTVLANYDYGPFGELIRASGPMAKLNPFRFSTKYDDDESDFLYYGYRYYNPSTGRWLNRDAIEEAGGLNLYEFVRNDTLNFYDFLGNACKCNGSPAWGAIGAYRTQWVLNPDDNLLYMGFLEQNWFWTRPDEGSDCHCTPARATMSLTSSRGLFSVTFTAKINWTGGPYKEPILLWWTCFRPDGTTWDVPHCGNSLTCNIDYGLPHFGFGCLQYVAKLTYMSCENNHWEVMPVVTQSGTITN